MSGSLIPAPDTSKTTLIEVHDLTKHFGTLSVLRGLSISIQSGQFVSILGRNGAGKTTLLRILAGLSSPSTGSVRIHGTSSLLPAAARGLIGYLAHATSLYMDLTALENLHFYARLYGLACRESDLVAQIERVGLSGRELEPVRNFSSGMQQRLAIARALLHDPTIILLDEPFTGLDQNGTEFLKHYLAGCRAQGKTCVMAIHDLQLGYDLSDRLVAIDRGSVALDLLRGSTTFEDFRAKYHELCGERRRAE
jgi:heme ABC exporter ATP-binding subunit CcmA